MRAAGWVLAAVIVARVSVSLLHGLRDLRSQPQAWSPRWSLIGLSGMVFLLAHAALVQTWRSVLACWDARLPFWSAARIWSVSNLGRYIPGKIWQIGAMGAMSREVGVSPIAASGSAILGTLVNVIAGFVVALVSGRVLLDRAFNGGGAIAQVIVFLSVAALAAAPIIVPRLAPLAARVAGRPLRATLPVRAVIIALAGNLLAWLLYGVAFELFARGLVPTSSGGYSAYLAAYTISYLAGYLALFAPAGAGVRESAMLAMLPFAGLADPAQAALITIGSRVWLTLLEVLPAVFFWAHHRARLRSPTPDPSDVPT